MAPSINNPIYANPTNINSVLIMGKDMMNRGGKKLGSSAQNGSEDRRFREVFGVSATVVFESWHRLLHYGLVPALGKFFHMMWAFMFMKLYNTETALCSYASGEGAVDPKTFRKWVWPFIEALDELGYYVVSLFAAQCFCIYYALIITF